ncbi:MAG: hypothetical protein PVJ39_13110 [Gammaproteobacteria bacterium]|jgi:hypothetical protein
MQPFEFMSLNRSIPMPTGTKVSGHNEIIKRFLADSARYLGLAPALAEKPDEELRAHFHQSPT